jgi:predicted DsbA family dithiol-disulfide isomerase
MLVEVWSDIVCPWCYLGKRRLESALARFPQAGEVRVVWRSFELDPAAPPRRSLSAAEHLASKYGMSRDQVEASWARLTSLGEVEGIEYRLDRTQGGSSFDAHRLVHAGAEHDLADAMVERLFRSYFTEGAPIGDAETLARVGVDAGLPADEVALVLAGDRFSAGVRDDEQQARLLGITGVPFFAIDGRFGVSGAQDSELLLHALTTAWAEREPVAQHG